MRRRQGGGQCVARGRVAISKAASVATGIRLVERVAELYAHCAGVGTV